MTCVCWERDRVLVTGGSGFLGRHLCEELRERGAASIIVPRQREFDLTQAEACARLFNEAQPDIVLHLAAEVGGIGANQQNPGRFFYANAAMGIHLIEEARKANVKRFVFIGTVCAYPKYTPVPFSEDDLWSGYPEETNAPYGVAKRALVVMLDAYKQQYGLKCSAVLPANLYGPGDNFDLESSHVIPALIRKFESAKTEGVDTVTCWGTGGVTREFLYVRDAANGICRAAEAITDPTPINLGTGVEVSIQATAQMISKIVGFEGGIVWDDSRPDGQPRRSLNVQRARQLLDWSARVPFQDGLQMTVEWWRRQGG